MDNNLRVILQQLETEKSIDRETLIEAIRSAIEQAAKKSMNRSANVIVEVDENTLAFKVFEIRTVAETITDPTSEITLDEALALNPGVVVGNRLKVPTEAHDFGRIAAQTAKQVIIQKIKDAEHERIFEEFNDRVGEVVTGVVKRHHRGDLFVTIGRAEAIVPYREQSPRENFKPGDRIRAYLSRVERSARGAQVVLSRTSPELVRLLFEMEVPEIYDGTVEIRGIAREAGSRTKVAVRSNDSNVDPVGACVGMKGTRVRAVVEELSGEKIDIVRWSDNPVELCANALNPADILDIQIDEPAGAIHVQVPQDQLSLAIGKKGQNARLASRLIGWNIDISGDGESASDPAERFNQLFPTLEDPDAAGEAAPPSAETQLHDAVLESAEAAPGSENGSGGAETAPEVEAVLNNMPGEAAETDDEEGAK